MRRFELHNRVLAWVAGALVATAVWAPVPTVYAAEDDTAAIAHAESLSSAFRAAARQVVPTVVQVRTTTKPAPMGRRGGTPNPFRGTPFEDFFGEGPPGSQFDGTPFAPAPGLGSGVIIDPSGVILTNNHVVADADEVTIELDDGRQFKGTDIKVDEKTDLAVLRIEAGEALPAARLGDSDGVDIGDWVLAIGTPFELDQSVSAGIISAKGRSLGILGRGSFLQTDAAINPGNSGGPLVNIRGEVVGINTAIFSRSGGYQGIGFAIPINLAKWVTPQLIKNGTVARSFLGVEIEKVTGDVAQELSVRPHRGVVVRNVFPDTPAGKAGLEEKDVILNFDGREVRDAAELQERVERSAPGSQHNLDILREGKPQTIEVTVEEMPQEFGVAEAEGGPSNDLEVPSLGLAVGELTESWAEQLGLQGQAGVLVKRVARGSIAFRGGIREGMIITRVDGAEVTDMAAFEAAMENAALEEGVALELKTKRGSQTVTLKVRD